jgi:hypothetical protein
MVRCQAARRLLSALVTGTIGQIHATTGGLGQMDLKPCRYFPTVGISRHALSAD